MKQNAFEWDNHKNAENLKKLGISFDFATIAFFDPDRIIAIDLDHSTNTEKRYFCIGKDGEGILTVRFTYRNEKIRIIGAGYWRKGKKAYENQN